MVGKRIRMLRQLRGMKQAHLAREAGLSQGTLSKIENGRHEPGLATTRRLALALGTSLDPLSAAEGASFTFTVRV